MKLEALQSLSVGVMIVGLFLSALGGFGAYFFSGGSERNGRAHNSARIESTEPDLPMRDVGEDSSLTPLVEPIDEVTARQLSLNPNPKLSPTPKKPPAPEPAAVPVPVATPPPIVAKTAVPDTAPPPPPVAEKLPPSQAAVSDLEKPKPATPESESHIATIEIPDKMPAPAPVAEKLSPPAPAKPGKLEPARVIPGTVAHSAELGVEPWQKDKLLQRLRSFQNGAIAIHVAEGNAEAMSFAAGLKEAFLTAGWKVTGITEVKAGRDETGLTLSSGTFPPPTEVTTIFSALVSAGIKLSTDLDPSQGKKHPILFVGSRP